MIRPATLADSEAIFDMAAKQTRVYPSLKSDTAKIKGGIKLAISTARHYVRVVDIGGKVEGVIIGLTSDNLWAQRQNCQVVLWVSHVPRAGAQLLRGFLAWVKSRRGIKLAGMAPDFDIDPRILYLVERIGFRKYGGSYLWYREVENGSVQ